jgi:hypothetical protein
VILSTSNIDGELDSPAVENIMTLKEDRGGPKIGERSLGVDKDRYGTCLNCIPRLNHPHRNSLLKECGGPRLAHL